MVTGSVLLADSDPGPSEKLARLISRTLPEIDLTVCTSARHSAEKLSRFQYSAVIVATHLIHQEASLLLRYRQTQHALVPLVVTAGHGERESARDALLHCGIFDVFARPVGSTVVLASIRVALWQARFLTLLARRERVVSQFACHLAAYPGERIPGGPRGGISKRVDETLKLVRECLTETDLHRLDLLLIDLARSVEEWTRERTLERLERTGNKSCQNIDGRHAPRLLFSFDVVW